MTVFPPDVKVLLISPSPSCLPGLRQALLAAGIDPPEVSHALPAAARDLLTDASPFRLVLLYDAPGECDALAVLPVVCNVPVVVVAGHDDFHRALQALQAGAFDVAIHQQLAAGWLPVVLQRALRNGHGVAPAVPAAPVEGLELSGDAFILWDLEGKISYWNEAASEMYGYSREEAVGQNVHALLHSELPAPLPKILEQARLEGEYEAEFQQTTRDGEPLLVWSRWVVRRDAAGVAEAILQNDHDITARKRIENALRQRERQFRTLAENLHSGVALVDESGTFTVVNQAFLRLFGFAAGAEIHNVNDRDWAQWQVFGEDGRLLDVDEHPVRKAALSLQPVHNQTVGVKSPGREELTWMLVSAVPLLKPDGGLEEMICHYVDVTEHRQAEEALHASEERYRTLFTSMSEGLGVLELLYDASGEAVDARYVTVNHVIERWMNRPAGDIVGRTLRETLPATDPERLRLYERVVRTGQPEHLEVLNPSLGRPLELHIYRTGVNQFAVLSTDITERKRAEEALRHSEARLAALLQVSSDAVYRMSPDWQEMYELGGSGFIAPTPQPSRDWQERYIHPDDQPRVREVIQQAIADKTPFDLEHRVRLMDGTLGWTHSRAVPVLDATGEVVEWFGAADDITARKQAEAEILAARREAERRAAEAEEGRRVLEALLDNIPAGVTIADAPDVNIRYVSKYGLDLTARLPEEIQNIPADQHTAAWGVYHTDLKTPGKGEELPLTRAVLQGEVVRNEEWVLMRGDGQFITILCNAGPIRDKDGNVTGGIIVWSDITERKQAEEALHRSESRFRRLSESGVVGVAFFDTDGSIYEVNATFLGMIGFTRADLEAGFIHWDKLTPPEWMSRTRQAVEEFHATGRITPYEKEYFRKDGTKFWGLFSGARLEHDRGGISIVIDITERKQAEAKIRRYNEELEQLVAERTAQIQKLEQQRYETEKQAVIGRMAAHVAHEINNPLAGIKNAFLLVKRAIPEDHKHYPFVDRIEKELERIARLVRQMFDLNKPAQHDATALNPARVVADVVELLAGNAHAQGVTVAVDAARADQMVALHEDSLRQVLVSTIQNAIEASAPGGVVRVQAALKNAHVALAIRDEGPGIPAEIHEQIFEPFFSTKKDLATGGLGLGLSITRSLVEALGGSITFESAPGEGTTFYVTLPVHAAQPLAAA